MSKEEDNILQQAQERLIRRRQELEKKGQRFRYAKVESGGVEKVIRRRRKNEPAAFTALLEAFQQEPGVRGLFTGRKKTLDDIEAAWQKVMPEYFADMTRVSGYRGGVLTVGLGSAALKQELETFHSQSLMQSLVTEPGLQKLTKIIFRLE